MSQIIDRRLNAGKKSTVNRQRFLRRFKQQIKRAVSDTIGKRSITDIDKGEQISIPTKDITEPRFQKGEGGTREYVLPGNQEFLKGDKIPRPSSQNQDGQGSQASADGEGEDNFIFELSREEFLELYFEDLELPHLVKKDLSQMATTKNVRAGIATHGIPANINVVRSMRQATSRRIALLKPKEKKHKKLLQQLATLESQEPDNSSAQDALRDEIAKLERKINAVPFIDTLDLRYNRRTKVQTPTTAAVMFCLMDVSGSMDEAKKDIAKRFFILLYLFLTKNYEKIELVFIRHHTSAKEVNEEEFFYSRETGGTVVSSALELLIGTIEARYPPANWNIYVAQASDGDNWNADSPYCMELLREKIMPLVQYFAYIEIMPRHHQSLWDVYQKIHAENKHFEMQNIDTVADIYPVFRELFKRKTA